MKLIFLGSGSAFTLGDNYQSNMIFVSEIDQKKMLFDCGSDARWSLKNQGFSFKDIDSVFISHLHADHVGGMEWLAFTTKFTPNIKKVKLYLMTEIEKTIWENVLKGGLTSLNEKEINLSTYFDVQIINADSFFTWSGIEFKPVKTSHVMAGCSHLMPSYGLFFTDHNVKVLITGDTQFTPEQAKPLYQAADIIFHDCELFKNKSGVHSHFEDLKTLTKEIKKKMWLYHYDSEALPNLEKEGFRGFVKKGQCFDFSDPKTLANPDKL